MIITKKKNMKRNINTYRFLLSNKIRTISDATLSAPTTPITVPLTISKTTNMDMLLENKQNKKQKRMKM